MDPEKMIGVRTPALRKLARELAKDKDGDELAGFLQDLPHTYFDEDQLHAFVISGMKDYDTCICHLERFLPYIDNWATCDQLSPKVLGRHKEELLEKIKGWIHSDRTYTVRFAIGMLMVCAVSLLTLVFRGSSHSLPVCAFAVRTVRIRPHK